MLGNLPCVSHMVLLKKIYIFTFLKNDYTRQNDKINVMKGKDDFAEEICKLGSS